jgi:hypothetical protein
MQTLTLKNIVEATFRGNSRYTLVVFDRLSSEQRKALHDLQSDPDFYGILYSPTQPGLGIKSVCRETALLYLTLQEPGRLPSYVKMLFKEKCNQAIAELVLDGILEIERNGVFVSGSDAHEFIYTEEPSLTTHGTLARLSVEALQYGQALEIHDSSKLSARLYFYNRLPLSLFWRRAFPTSDAVAKYLGIQTSGATKVLLDRHWRKVSPLPSNGWRIWESCHARAAFEEPTAIYKLYVSPACSHMREAFQTTVAVLSKLQAPNFKIGIDVYGLLRPDKIIAYFRSFDELGEAAEHMGHELEGMPAHGVPFTAEIAGHGLLSWGIDPPAEQQVLSWQGRESWRLWVTNRLAIALLAAREAPSSKLEPWQFAMERLRLEGIDTTTWTPAINMW